MENKRWLCCQLDADITVGVSNQENVMYTLGAVLVFVDTQVG